MSRMEFSGSSPEDIMYAKSLWKSAHLTPPQESRLTQNGVVRNSSKSQQQQQQPHSINGAAGAMSSSTTHKAALRDPPMADAGRNTVTAQMYRDKCAMLAQRSTLRREIQSLFREQQERQQAWRGSLNYGQHAGRPMYKLPDIEPPSDVMAEELLE